jgi:hypothetical protein
MREAVLGGVVLEDGAIVLLAASRYWLSRDLGASWDEVATPSLATSIAELDELLAVGTFGGIAYGRPGAPLVLVAGPRFNRVTASDTGFAAVDHAQNVWIGTNPAALADWGTSGTPVISAVLATDPALGSPVAYAGDRDGDVWRNDGGGWTACADLPTLDHPTIVQMAATGSDLLVAPAQHGPYLSTDGCATFEDRYIGRENAFGTEGGPVDDAEAWSGLWAARGAWRTSGWAGAYATDDAGAAWSEAWLVPAEYTRGLAFSPVSPDTIVLGAYGAGPVVTHDLGATFEFTNSGMDRTDVLEVAFGPTGRLLANVGHHPFSSRDDGATWTSMDTPFATVATLREFDAADLWVLAGLGGEGDEIGPIAHSTDGGDTWTVLARPTGVADAAMPIDVARVDGSWCVVYVSQPAVVCSADLSTWSVAYANPSASMVTGLATTPADPGAVWVADDDGIHRVTLSGDVQTPWTIADDPIPAVTAADDGTVFAGTLAGRILRGGTAGFTDLGVSLPAYADVLAARPQFAATGDLLAGGFDGVYHVDGADGDSPTVRRFGYDVLDDSVMVEYAGTGCAVEGRVGAVLDRVVRIGPGCRARAAVRGSTVRVLGASDDATSDTRIRIDGVERCAVGSAVSDLGTVCETTGLADGWHLIDVEGIGGSGVRIDAFRGLRATAPLDPVVPEDSGDSGSTDSADTDTEDPARCGCRGRSALVFALVPLAIARRRSRASRR